MPQFNSASFIFPKIQSLPQVLGDPRLRTDVLLQIQNGVDTYAAFRSLTLPEQEAFLDFCVGNGDSKLHMIPFSNISFIQKHVLGDWIACFPVFWIRK